MELHFQRFSGNFANAEDGKIQIPLPGMGNWYYQVKIFSSPPDQFLPGNIELPSHLDHPRDATRSPTEPEMRVLSAFNPLSIYADVIVIDSKVMFNRDVLSATYVWDFWKTSSHTNLFSRVSGVPTDS